jgi:hypothetical protein
MIKVFFHLVQMLLKLIKSNRSIKMNHLKCSASARERRESVSGERARERGIEQL